MRILLIPALFTLPLVGQTIGKQRLKPAASKSQRQDTPRLQLVTEWVRELSAFRDITDKYQKEKTEGNNPMLDTIRTGTRSKLELQTSIHILKGMKLTEKPFNNLIPAVIKSYEMKIHLHSEVIDIAGKFIVPKAGVDYGKLAARMPEITATMEQIDQTLFQCNQLFTGMLISEKENSKGQADHLIITSDERKNLASKLRDHFGDDLSAKDQNYNTASASVLYGLLIGNHKSSDEPWD